MSQLPACGVLNLSCDGSSITFRLLGLGRADHPHECEVASLRQVVSLLRKDSSKPGAVTMQPAPRRSDATARDDQLVHALGWMTENHYSVQCSGLEVVLKALHSGDQQRL
jgi:hypothetical protein